MATKYEELEKLSELKQKGILTEEEFLKKKQEILESQPKMEESAKFTQKDQYASLNDHQKKAFIKFDQIIKNAKETGKMPGNTALWYWNWAAFFFGPFWFIAKGRFVDLIVYIIIIIIGIVTGGAFLPVAGIYCFGFAFWGDFLEYYKFKTGKKTWWITPKKMVGELISM